MVVHPIDDYISKKLKDLDITLGDFINNRVCMAEILTDGEYDQFNPYGSLTFPVRDIFRYWWTKYADQDAVIDMVLDDLMTEYKDRLLPDQECGQSVDLTDAIDGFTDIQKVAESSVHDSSA